jgi:hypothetical protein
MFNCRCLYIIIYQSTRHNIPGDLQIYNLLIFSVRVLILFLRDIYIYIYIYMLCLPINLYYNCFRNAEVGTETANTKARYQTEG